MSDDRTIDHRIAAWLEQEAAGDLPDRVLESVFTETRLARRRTLPFAGRFQPVSRFASTLVAVGAAAIVVVVLGVALLGNRPSSGIGGTPSTSASANPSVTEPTAAPSAVAQATSAPKPMVIAAATYPSPFAVPFTITWPSAIPQPGIAADNIEIHASNGTGLNVYVITKVGANPCTTDDLGPRVLTKPQEFMDWLAAIPHVTALPESQVTIGGLPALEREIDIGTLTGCIDTLYLHSNIRSTRDNAQGGFLMAAGERERWVAFNVDGKLIAFTVWPLADQAYVTVADQAISTISFAP